MSSPRPPLLLLDTVPNRGLRRSNRSGLDIAGRLRRYRTTPSRMEIDDCIAHSTDNQRLPSTKPIDERWDRSRYNILRNAKHNALRDLRWTQNDPITFAMIPGTSRSYARQALPKRSTPTSAAALSGQNTRVDNPEQASITQADRQREKRDQDLQHRERIVRDLEAKMKSFKEQARKDTKAILEKERAALQQEKVKNTNELGKTRSDIERERAGIPKLKEQALAAAKEEAQKSYENRNKELIRVRKEMERDHAGKAAALKEEKILLDSGWADLGVKESAIEATIAQRAEEIEANIRQELREALDSASSKHAEAQTKLDEAQEVLGAAQQNREEAITDRAQLSQSYQRRLEDFSKNHKKFLETLQEASKHEKAIAIGNFREKLENAEFRERVERVDYDGYWELWQGLQSSAVSFVSDFDLVSKQLGDAVAAWNKAGTQLARFEHVHPPFKSKYPDIHAQIHQHHKQSRDRAVHAFENIRNRAEHLRLDLRPRLSYQSHYSRMLTRVTRMDRSQSPDVLIEVASEVLGRQLLVDQGKTLIARRKELQAQLKANRNDAESAKLAAEIEEVEKQYNSIDAYEQFVTALSKYLGFKHLREGSVREKEVWNATDSVDRRLAAAGRPWKIFSRDNPGRVQDSEVSREEQERDRQNIKQVLRSLRADYNEYNAVVQEGSLLEEQLGKGGKAITKINKQIDEEVGKAKSLMQKKLARLGGEALLGQRSGTFAFGPASPATRASSEPRRRFVAAGNASATPLEVPLRGTISDPVSTGGSRGPHIKGEIARLTLELRKAEAYKHGEERQQAEEKLEKLKQEDRRFDLLLLRQARAALLKDPNSDSRMLRSNERNIAGLVRRLGVTSSGSETLRTSNHKSISADAVRRKSEKRSAKRARLRARNQHAQALAPTKSNTSSELNNSAGAVLGFKPTPSKQASHALWVPQGHLLCYAQKKGPAAHGANATMMSRILAPSEDAIFVPRALQIYSLHSLHADAHGGQPGSDQQTIIDSASHSTLPIMHSFDESIPLTQSSMDTISNPESDDSYEPSDSEGSIAASEPIQFSQESDMDPTSSLTSTQEFTDALETLSAPDSALPLEQDVSNLTYNISAEDYRRAAMASKSTSAAYWTYKLYKNAEGKTPTVHYCTTLETAETQAKQFLNEPIIGFDLEWEVGSSPGKSSIKNCVSLVQIASETKIGLFQLAMFKGDTAEQLMPPSLRKILESREITKTGVNISGDASRIEKCFGFKMQGIFELSHLYNVVTWSEKSPERVNKKLLKLADQVQNVLLLPLKKDAVRVSKWSQRLRPEQTEYAASDAYAGFRIYHTLEAKRKKMDPTPPRPAFWEEKKPLVLGDGTVVVPRKIVKTKIDTDGKVVEDEDDEGEEYFDAVETLDPYELDPTATGGIPLQGLSISYPTLPSLAETLAESDLPHQPRNQSSNATPVQSASTSSTPAQTGVDQKPKPTILSSPAVLAADTWAQNIRNSLPSTHALSKKQAHLRAYHLWHHQRHECKDVASLLRDPPLSVQTVASYVMQTVVEGKELLAPLAVEGALAGTVAPSQAASQARQNDDKARVEVVLGLLPSSVRHKYFWVVERIERMEMERKL